MADEWLTSDAAARFLGVRRSTLYAYVSREQLESRAQLGTRRRLYRREDVERLRRRARSVRSPAQVARDALDWGTPVLDTELTAIEDGRIHLCGVSLEELTREASLEATAGLLWAGKRDSALFDRSLDPLPAAWRSALETLESAHPGVRFQMLLALAAAQDLNAADPRNDRVPQSGARLLQAMFRAAAGLTRPCAMPFDRVLQRAWAPRREQARGPLAAALVLCADHELNVSSFVVRCVASAGSTPYDGVMAGIAALRGHRHGGMSDRCEALLAEVGVPPLELSRRPGGAHPEPGRDLRRHVAGVLSARLQRGEGVPGFHQHPLHPSGDPRYGLLLETMKLSLGAEGAFWEWVEALTEEGEALLGEKPTIDLGLALLSRSLGCTPGTAWTLFALGRTVGWIAHFLEERRRDRLIRPRARYTGPPVPPTSKTA